MGVFGRGQNRERGGVILTLTKSLLQRVRISRNAERFRLLARAFFSVRYSVTFRYCVQVNEDTIVWFSAAGRTILLVFEEEKLF